MRSSCSTFPIPLSGPDNQSHTCLVSPILVDLLPRVSHPHYRACYDSILLLKHVQQAAGDPSPTPCDLNISFWGQQTRLHHLSPKVTIEDAEDEDGEQFTEQIVENKPAEQQKSLQMDLLLLGHLWTHQEVQNRQKENFTVTS